MKLAVFDIDGVIYDGHIIFDLIKLQEEHKFIKSGTWKQIEELLVNYKSGKISYDIAANAMLDIYAKSLRGKKYSDAKKILANFIKNNKHKFYPYFVEVLPKLKESYDVYFLSTNLIFTTETLTQHFGLKGFLSTEEEVINGKFSGKIIKSLAGSKHVIEKLLEKYSYDGSFAVGDSVNDISMLDRVENAICINPDSDLLKESKQKGWKTVDENSISEILLSLIK